MALLAAGCGREAAPSAASAAAASPEKILNVYNWADFIEPSVIADFEREFGIKVHYDVYESNETMEAKLLAGHSNYDIAVPGGAFFAKEVKAGVYQALDDARLPNLRNLDPGAVRATAIYDAGNRHGVDYMWLVSTGLGYDAAKVRARAVDAPVGSWRLLFDPAVAGRLKDCGISVLDSPEDVVGAALAFLGKDPNSESPEDLAAAGEVLKTLRPLVRYVDSSRYIEDLANGDLCLALGWSGDVVQARQRGKEAGKGASIVYVIPSEGSVSAVDVLAIPADAPHVANAYTFINYLLRPEVAAKNAAATSYASGVIGVGADEAVYPPPEVRARLKPLRAKSPEFTRALMRLWTKFKTGA
jgi:putrescine transport system substrate-binding protein